MKTKRRKAVKTLLWCEQLEFRCVLSTIVDWGPSSPSADSDGDFHAVIVAGAPSGSPADSPANRVDANLATSPYAGVGSLQISTRRGTYICTATAIDDTHVLTAAHCIDLNNDGRSDRKDGIKNIDFHLNLDADNSTDLTVRAASWTPHPDFTGFNRPSVNDDLAVITLGASLPTDVPKYVLSSTPMVAGATHLYLVGYGRSGDGVSGYTTDASWTIKRKGENIVDAFYAQDDAGKSSANEVFRFDFDGPSGNGSFGGPTLGNDKETTLGGGDSGGPSFALADPSHPELASSYELVGVNTFTQGFNAPKFGSLGGGVNIVPYRNWILGAATSSFGSSLGGASDTVGGPGPGTALGIAVASLPLGPLGSPVDQAAWTSPDGSEGGLSAPATDRADTLAHLPQNTETVLGEPMVAVVPRGSSSLADGCASADDDESHEVVDHIFEEWLADEEA